MAATIDQIVDSIKAKYPELDLENVPSITLQEFSRMRTDYVKGKSVFLNIHFAQSNPLVMVGEEFIISLHVPSTSLQVFRLGPISATVEVAFLPLDSAQPVQDWFDRLDPDAPTGAIRNHWVHTGHGTTLSRTRKTCHSCGFTSSVAWRNNVDGSRNKCQNSACGVLREEGGRHIVRFVRRSRTANNVGN